MYIPKDFVGKDRAQTIAFMQRYNFALLITADGDIPMATHLPFVLSERGDELILTSHLARENPHAAHLFANENLVVFSEPHAYISPSHYEKEENVPTWNYLAVHAYGKAKRIEEETALMAVLENMIEAYEPKYKAQWERLSAKYKNGLAKDIVAFEIQVNRLDSKEKLSQNKRQKERNNIIEAFSKSTDSNENTIAAYMKQRKSKFD